MNLGLQGKEARVGPLALQDLRAPQVLAENQGRKDKVVPLEKWAPLDLEERVDYKGHQVLQDPRVNLDRADLQVLQANPVCVERMACLVPQVRFLILIIIIHSYIFILQGHVPQSNQEQIGAYLSICS